MNSLISRAQCALLVIFLGCGTVAHAGGVSVGFKAPVQCSNLIGKWSGQAKVTAAWGALTCYYDGVAVFSEHQAQWRPEPYDLALTFNLQKSPSSWGCPSDRNVTLTATCDATTGEVVVDAAGAYSVKGTLNQEATNVNLNGEVYVAGITANFDATLNKNVW